MQSKVSKEQDLVSLTGAYSFRVVKIFDLTSKSAHPTVDLKVSTVHFVIPTDFCSSHFVHYVLLLSTSYVDCSQLISQSGAF